MRKSASLMELHAEPIDINSVHANYKILGSGATPNQWTGPHQLCIGLHIPSKHEVLAQCWADVGPAS